MRNKVEIRAFAIEQVVKMRCMSDCTIEDVVKQSRLVENYLIGDAKIAEYEDTLSPLREALCEMQEMYNSLNKHNSMHGCGVKDDDELGVKYAN